MTNEECQASLRILCAMVKADGHLHPREGDALRVLAESAFGGEPADIERDVDVELECKRLTSDRAKRLTFSAAMVIADVDEERSPHETALLAQIHAALGLIGEPESGLVAAVHRARMGLLTVKLAEAQAEFLRAVQNLSKSGSMDAKAYEGLLDELDLKKTALLSGAV